MSKKPFWALRVLACMVGIVVCFVIESSLSIRISVLGAHFDLLPPIVASAAICLGSPAGILCGIVAGLMYDSSGAEIEGLYPLYYMCWGIIGGMLGERKRVRQLNMIIMLSIEMTALLSLLRYLFYFQFIVDTSLIFVVKAIVASALLTMLVCPFVYLAVRAIAGGGPQRLKKRERHRRKDRDGET